MSSGNKYHRRIYSLTRTASATVDVYAVLEAFDVRCPARQHAIKKLLCAGIRGKGDAIQDLTETRDAIDRAIAMEHQRVMRLLDETPSIAKAEAVSKLSGVMLKERQRGDAPEPPPRGSLVVETFAGIAHTTCLTCHKTVNYREEAKRPALCRACVPPEEEVGPDAPTPVADMVTALRTGQFTGGVQVNPEPVVKKTPELFPDGWDDDDED